jgi:hypothetical protein
MDERRDKAEKKPGHVEAGHASETGSRIPYERSAAGEDDTPIQHTYQTADGREVTETIRTADATFVPEGDAETE